MNYLGISCGHHDGAVSLVRDGAIIFAGHSERWSKIKGDPTVNPQMLDYALTMADDHRIQINFYERPLIKATRKLWAGQSITADDFNVRSVIGSNIVGRLANPHIKTWSHHLSHCAAGFQTSPYSESTAVVIDAIGEWDTVTIWRCWMDDIGRAKYKLLWRRMYPNSIGLFYSAVTARAGLNPLDEEYILMGMSGWGQPTLVDQIKDFIVDTENVKMKTNLHSGIPEHLLENADPFDLAASAQSVLEDTICTIMEIARKLNNSDNLVYGGGVALNCLANRLLGNYYPNIWVMPNPGDAGASLGAAALGWGKKLRWDNSFLGYQIPGEYPVGDVIETLLSEKISGVAAGRAEWGPRALGNRSLLADPRWPDIKDRVNEIKHRQKFRPFAPAILEEFTEQYFECSPGWTVNRYMQSVARCKNPDLYPAITHIDGTSRVQTVPPDGTGIRKLLEIWYEKTGCPMLLNTSLNIRGQPMVNTIEDAEKFSTLYGIPVFTSSK